MSHRTKRTVLVGLLLALFAFLMLSMGLSNLKLEQGIPFPRGTNVDEGFNPVSPLPPRNMRPLPLLEIILGVVLVALMIYVPARLIALVNIRKVLALVLGIVLLIALLNTLPYLALGPPATSRVSSPVAPTISTLERPPSSPSKMPCLFLWLIASFFLAGTGLLTAAILKRTPTTTPSNEALSFAAEHALDELRTGDDFAGVIIRCYLQMTDVLRTERGLERHYAMTVREFQAWLEEKGLPGDPVHLLTCLFEKARYSNQSMNQLDQDAGRECLVQIIQYCRKGVSDSV